MDAAGHFADHVIATRFADLSETTRSAAARLILDSVGVGLSGSAGQWAAELSGAAVGWGQGAHCRVLGRNGRFPPGLAAFHNAYNIHNSEFDCLHEDAVVHALTAILPAALAVAEHQGGVSGQTLIEAVVAGVDIAAAIGLAGTSAMKFFRPAVVGGFGAVAAAAKIAGLDRDQMITAFGAQYAQSGGSMQAHEEGTMLLALQIGFNARAAVEAVDLARAGLKATQHTFDGRFGYFNLFEDTVDLAPVLADLPRVRRVEQVVEKPFPTGRATHGAIEAVMRLQARRASDPAMLHDLTVTVSPVAYTLVGRPARIGMPANYARLCLSYCVARCLLDGTVGVGHFTPAALAELDPLMLAERIEVQTFDMAEPSAFGPCRVTLDYADGTSASETVGQALGHPENPVTADQRMAKFRANCQAAALPLSQDQATTLAGRIDTLETLHDVRALMDLACPLAG
ncbi:MmgE/PrpD family protein [Thalassovita gelatinovora]|uniref:MmgE/PrpD family protein n=1 Tax=Thalassovita gelatinovora TaxID=53501 RepID=A0A0N7LU26_THAGE|nr:MmgE/PrpD family protein [Thalassovita gelatinovora]QIZ81786.1 MmgE/PrpD family protein [Thalassovita gelatinovora]CUH62322.1 MmgE/PrpD family protein [Thalassovita gelatinovora]SER15628.1 2-methylcitrate dehydratase PrpD [Thalassovita gelatinovora]